MLEDDCWYVVNGLGCYDRIDTIIQIDRQTDRQTERQIDNYLDYQMSVNDCWYVVNDLDCYDRIDTKVQIDRQIMITQIIRCL